MSDALNTFIPFELETGETVNLTLTYRNLLKLKTKHRDQYAEYNKVMTKGAQDEFDNLTVVYTAYLCGLIAENGDTDGCMDYEEFLSVVTPDREYLMTTLAMLIAPKKATASGGRS